MSSSLLLLSSSLLRIVCRASPLEIESRLWFGHRGLRHERIAEALANTLAVLQCGRQAEGSGAGMLGLAGPPGGVWPTSTSSCDVSSLEEGYGPLHGVNKDQNPGIVAL